MNGKQRATTQILVATLTLMLAHATVASAETIGSGDGAGITSAIRINLPFLAVGMLDGQYEHALSAGSSYSIRGFYATELVLTGLSGGGVGASYQWFPSALGNLEGFYVSPGLDLAYLQVSDDSVVAVVFGFSPFTMAGYNWNYDNGLTFGLAAGLSYNSIIGGVAGTGGSTVDTVSGPFVKAAINLGWVL